MKYVLIACRILLALVFIVFGFEKLHDFMHAPMPPADSLPGKFMVVMFTSGYLKAIGVFEILGGLLMLSRRTVPAGLCIICPIAVNILLFDFLIAGGQGLLPGLVVTVLALVLVYGYRSSFAGILSFDAKPSA
jgi:putative oxidoreductase